MLHNFALTVIIIYFTFIISGESSVQIRLLGNETGHLRTNKISRSGEEDGEGNQENTGNCWMTMDAKEHIETMIALDEKYADTREKFQKKIEKDRIKFDKDVLEAMITTKGVVNPGESLSQIPAGINLGGYAMVRMPESMLFFHRMKLRNATYFRINSLETDLHLMRIKAHFSLNDLHLFGNYERSITEEGDPSSFLYQPTYGHAEIQLKEVEFLVEGRLRLIDDGLFIVLTTSDLTFTAGWLTYVKVNSEKSIHITKAAIGEFLDRMKGDLDEWVKDYLNEKLMFFKQIGKAVTSNVRMYQNERTETLNKYVQKALSYIKTKLSDLNASSVKLPKFKIASAKGVKLVMTDGVLRGLDSIYRRSVATGGIEGKIHKVDAIVGFSTLKVIYKYTAYLDMGMPPLVGTFILSADEVTALMSLSLLEDPENVDLNFGFIHQMKPESLTVEGPANRMIPNFKHVLEHEIITFMATALNHNIRSLNSLLRCHPRLFPYGEPEKAQPERQIQKLAGGKEILY